MTITKEEVAEAVRAWCAAHNTRDIQTIIAMEAQAGGFGFRDLDWRDHAVQGEEARAQLFERFFDRMDYHRLEL
jgi:ketosteroid isomerase-like protein